MDSAGGARGHATSPAPHGMLAVAARRPGAFSPLPSARTPPASVSSAHTHGSSHSPNLPAQRPTSSDGSDSSGSSRVTAMATGPAPPASATMTGRRPAFRQTPPTLMASSGSSSSPSLHSFHRPGAPHELPPHRQSPLNPGIDPRSHKRNNSQGFFEPSLPTASLVDQSSGSTSGLSASQIAAQAAMQHLQTGAVTHQRKRSQTIPGPESPPEQSSRMKAKPPPPLPTASLTSIPRKTSDGYSASFSSSNGGRSPTSAAAASAASAAFPRTASRSPAAQSFAEAGGRSAAPSPLPTVTGPTDVKVKPERSKIKLFSKPKHIGTSASKDTDRRERTLPSPSKAASPAPSLFKNLNASSTSLLDTTTPSSASFYSVANSSTSTLVPAKTEDKEKAHRHHFLSRQKHKIKDRLDDHQISLSSASSNSRPTDPSAPQSLYSFTPSSPGVSQGSISKSVSGFDLRHGGRALREKKREEKAAAAAAAATSLPDGKRLQDADRGDWLSTNNLGPPTGGSVAFPTTASNLEAPYGNLSGFGLNNLTAEDAWDFLKAKMLIIFEGEELRMPVEDLNRLVLVHVNWCMQKRAPHVLTEDLEDLLSTGYSSLEHTLRGAPDERLVPYLVETWLFVFGVVLPYMQAVFFPLDLEFRGQGSLMTPREAADFWGPAAGALANGLLSPGHSGGTDDGAVDSALDVRRIVLRSFRDHIVLPRHDALQATFSRLSLESIHGGGPDLPLGLPRPPPIRPGTASSSSGGVDIGSSSFNSQGSTLLGDGSRSRATSNTSAPDLPSFSSPGGKRRAAAAAAAAAANSTAMANATAEHAHQQHHHGSGGMVSNSNSGLASVSTPALSNTTIPTPSSTHSFSSARLTTPTTASPTPMPPGLDSARVTETVGRMLQCMLVLASLRSGDEAQAKMESLTRALKLNWLGRGRTGRNRKGLIGGRMPRI